MDISTFFGDISAAAGFGNFEPVKLGSFGFSQYEVPEHIRFGGRQKQTVHIRPGGQRQIDTLGPEAHPIAWEGIFLSSDAACRAQQLDALRAKGDALDLCWGQFRYRVVIEALELEYRRQNYVTYKIACNVLQPSAKAQSQTLLGSITKGLSDALGVDVAGTLTTVNTALKQITPMVSAVSTLTGGSPAALGILSAVNGAQGVTGGLLNAANGNIMGMTQITSTFTGNSKIIGVLGGLGAAVNDAPALLGIDSHLGVMSRNLTNPAT